MPDRLKANTKQRRRDVNHQVHCMHEDQNTSTCKQIHTGISAHESVFTSLTGEE